MISEENIKRINELAKKQKTVGLTPQEAEEQQFLRRLYVETIKKNLKNSLEQLKFQKRHNHQCSCGHCHPKN
ncbi:MAG TPA: DUF896 domain-containing protein [Clostridia bacterium]|jgi:uncharacterized protein YnzC (UPF0291/DUF896 family)|nr:DUF896 domain-containing protein [Clostridia bacterium]